MKEQPWQIENWRLSLSSCIRVRVVPRYLTISESKHEVSHSSCHPINESAKIRLAATATLTARV